MTREHKLALILGFAVVLAVGVLISDHLSSASASRLEEDLDPTGRSAVGSVQASLPVISPTVESVPPTFAESLAQRFREMERPPAVQTETAGAPAPETDRIGGPLADAGDAAGDSWDSGFERGIPTITMRPEPVGAGTSVEERANAALATKAAAPGKRHVVQEGESLWAIAEQHYGDGRLYARLAKFNTGKVGADGELNEGATLVIPAKEDLTRDPGAVGATTATGPTAQPVGAKGDRTYTIREGDTLSEIAQRTLGSARRWNEIYALNKTVIDDPDVAPAGVTIRLPSR